MGEGGDKPLTLRRYTIGTPYEFVEEHYKSPVYIYNFGQGQSPLFFLSVYSQKSYVWYLVDSVAKLHLLRYPATLLVGFTLRSNNYIVSGFTSVCNLA